MTRALLAAALLLLLLGLAACEDAFGPGATPTPVGAPSPVASPTPTGTPGPAPSSTPTLTSTPSGTPTPSPTATPTEGPVRTPVGGAAGGEFQDSLAAMERARSFSYALWLSVGPPEAQYVLTGTGVYSAPHSFHTTYQWLEFPAEVISIGLENYYRVNNGPWRWGELPAQLYPLGAPPPPGDLLDLITYALDASLLGAEEVNGTPARRMRFILRPDALPGVRGPFEGLAGGDLWVDANTHRFLKLRLVAEPTGSQDSNRAELTMTFAAYNTPLTIRRPQ